MGPKNTYYPTFALHLRSWLLCSTVLLLYHYIYQPSQSKQPQRVCGTSILWIRRGLPTSRPGACFPVCRFPPAFVNRGFPTICSILIGTHYGPENYVFPCVYTPYSVLIINTSYQKLPFGFGDDPDKLFFFFFPFFLNNYYVTQGSGCYVPY